MGAVRLPSGDAIPVASIDRAAATILTMDGQQLAVTDWADEEGLVIDAPIDARFCAAGPDAYGHSWTVDLVRREARVHKLAETLR